jgi:hypothetical protein
MTDEATEHKDTEPKPALAGSVGGIIHSGGEQTVSAETPPYEGIRQTGGPDETGPGYGKTEDHLAFDAEKSPAGYPGREVSQEERSGMDPADPAPGPVQGVGESRSTEYGKGDFTDLGTQGESERPVGGAKPEQSTGVDPQSSREGSPEMLTGDQGG